MVATIEEVVTIEEPSAIKFIHDSILLMVNPNLSIIGQYNCSLTNTAMP
jgi:hypothetical protein